MSFWIVEVTVALVCHSSLSTLAVSFFFFFFLLRFLFIVLRASYQTCATRL